MIDDNVTISEMAASGAITTRLYNALTVAGFDTVGSLRLTPHWELLRNPGIGTKSLKWLSDIGVLDRDIYGRPIQDSLRVLERKPAPWFEFAH